MTLFETEIIESSKRSTMLKSRVWASCFSDSEWDSVCVHGYISQGGECCVGLTDLRIWMVGKWVTLEICGVFPAFWVSLAFATVSGHALNGTCAYLCVWTASSLSPGFITLAQHSKETAKLRGTLWSRSMQDEKDKTVNRVGTGWLETQGFKWKNISMKCYQTQEK